MSLTMRVEVRGFDEVQRKLSRLSTALARDQAMAMALNRVADRGRAEINRAVTERYAIKGDEVRNSVAIRRAVNKPGRLTAEISVFGSPSRRGRSVNLIRFLAAAQVQGRAVKLRGARTRRADLAALGRELGFQIRRGGGLKRIPGAFVGNRGRTVFRRTGKARLPIEPVQVIGVSQMFASREISARVLARINATLGVEVERAVAKLLARP